MTMAVSGLSGRVTFVTGPGKGSGKTAFLNYSLGLLRRSGESPAFLGVGFDGEAASSGRSSLIPCQPGELFVSAERYMRSSGCEPEIVAVLPGSGSLGRLAVARARRPGLAVLVGPESNEVAAHAIAVMRGEFGARTVLVDGAMNRITQISAFAGASFIFVLSAGPGEVGSVVRSMRRIRLLAGLPVLGESARDDPSLRSCEAGLPTPARFLPGPLTRLTLARLGEGEGTIVVEDFTKVFLGWEELSALLRSRPLAVLHAAAFGGFVVRLRDVGQAAFAAAIDDPALESMIAWNPYEAAADA